MTLGSEFAVKHEIITVIGSVSRVAFKKEIMYHINPYLRNAGDKGAQLDSQQVWGVFPLSLKCGGEEEFIKLRKISDNNSLSILSYLRIFQITKTVDYHKAINISVSKVFVSQFTKFVNAKISSS